MLFQSIPLSRFCIIHLLFTFQVLILFNLDHIISHLREGSLPLVRHFYFCSITTCLFTWIFLNSLPNALPLKTFTISFRRTRSITAPSALHPKCKSKCFWHILLEIFPTYLSDHYTFILADLLSCTYFSSVCISVFI